MSEIPLGGSYSATMMPRPGWSRHRTARVTTAVIAIRSARIAAIAEVMAAGDEGNRSSPGFEGSGRKPTASVRFSYGPSAEAWATSAGSAPASTLSSSHGVADPS